jgi:hypothetical protein
MRFPTLSVRYLMNKLVGYHTPPKVYSQFYAPVPDCKITAVYLNGKEIKGFKPYKVKLGEPINFQRLGVTKKMILTNM